MIEIARGVIRGGEAIQRIIGVIDGCGGLAGPTRQGDYPGRASGQRAVILRIGPELDIVKICMKLTTTLGKCKCYMVDCQSC